VCASLILIKEINIYSFFSLTLQCNSNNMGQKMTCIFFIFSYIINKFVGIANLWENNNKSILSTICMSDGNHVVDNTDDLSSLYKGSITNEGSRATMPMLMTEPHSGVDDAADNQQDWQDFDGDINDLLSSHPPTHLRQSKRQKSLCSSLPTYKV
jgi:hypothetical protein